LGDTKKKMGTLNRKIYILHGWTYSLEKWNYFSNLLKNDGFETVFLKIPGLTETSDEVWDLEKYSRWLEKKIGKSKVILLGHSNGGRIASYYAAINPEKVEKLILIDSAGIFHKDLLIRVKRLVFRCIASIGKKFTNSYALKKLLYKVAGEKDYFEASDNIKKSMINLINADLTPAFKLIKTDTLIIWGKNDKTTPVSDGMLIHKLIEGSRLKIIDNAGHSPFFNHAKEVAGIIKNDF
jgi:pimeloyl-ACP methyl ester carboxylesterase